MIPIKEVKNCFGFFNGYHFLSQIIQMFIHHNY
nr:MAG TPA: hypothetical protein [Bacteriophage sp.]